MTALNKSPSCLTALSAEQKAGHMVLSHDIAIVCRIFLERDLFSFIQWT